VGEFLCFIREVSQVNAISVLVGNKKDLENERRVLNETAYDYAMENEIK
jgi:hypothetical protein